MSRKRRCHPRTISMRKLGRANGRSPKPQRARRVAERLRAARASIVFGNGEECS
jgi:hypothetical protein